MKNTNIVKIRQLLKKAITCSAFPGTIIIEDEVYYQILALLPCETCGGTGKKPESKSYPDGLTIGREGKPCFNCQSTQKFNRKEPK